MVHHFRLYIAGDSSRSRQAIANLNTLCGRALPGSHEIDVIDVIERPDLAGEASVLATPLVIRVDPPPVRRAVGDFADLRRLAAAMDLHDPASDSRGPA